MITPFSINNDNLTLLDREWAIREIDPIRAWGSDGHIILLIRLESPPPKDRKSDADIHFLKREIGISRFPRLYNEVCPCGSTELYLCPDNGRKWFAVNAGSGPPADGATVWCECCGLLRFIRLDENTLGRDWLEGL